jgi:hypothetical protein
LGTDLALFLSAKSPQNIISKEYESSTYSSKQTPRAYRMAEILRKNLDRDQLSSRLFPVIPDETGGFLFALQEGPYFFFLFKSYLAELYFCFRTPISVEIILCKFSFPGSKPDSIVGGQPPIS